MRVFTILTLLLMSFNLFSQVEESTDCFERISSRYLQNAIKYDGGIQHTRGILAGVQVHTFSIDPSRLGFNTNEITGETYEDDGNGVWYFVWRTSKTRNSWQRVDVDCEVSTIVITNPSPRFIECDFFFQNLTSSPPIKASYKNSFVYDTHFNQVFRNSHIVKSKN